MQCRILKNVLCCRKAIHSILNSGKPSTPRKRSTEIIVSKERVPVGRPVIDRNIRPRGIDHLDGISRHIIRFHRHGGIKHEILLVRHPAILYRRRDKHVAERVRKEPLRTCKFLHRRLQRICARESIPHVAIVVGSDVLKERHRFGSRFVSLGVGLNTRNGIFIPPGPTNCHCPYSTP